MKSNYNSDKERNRFLKLRYKDGATIDDAPFISARKLSETCPISTGKISQLEDASLKDYNPITKERGDIPSCQASVLRLYHDKFGCSYDYLMGETTNRKAEYTEIGKDPILGCLTDSFWDNLKELLSNEGFQDFNQYMIEAFMSNPQWLQWFMHTVFLHLYNINVINDNSTLTKAEKDVSSAYYWSSLNTKVNEFFSKLLLPSLAKGFEQYELKNKERLKEKEKRDRIEHENFEKELQNQELIRQLFPDDSPLPATVKDIITISADSKKDSY